MEESIEIVEYRKKNVFKGLNAANNKLYKTSMLLCNEFGRLPNQVIEYFNRYKA